MRRHDRVTIFSGDCSVSSSRRTPGNSGCRQGVGEMWRRFFASAPPGRLERGSASCSSGKWWQQGRGSAAVAGAPSRGGRWHRTDLPPGAAQPICPPTMRSRESNRKPLTDSRRLDGQALAGPELSLIRERGAGDHDARGEVISRIYEELRVVAGRMMQRERVRFTPLPTAVVHETVMRLLGEAVFDSARTETSC